MDIPSLHASASSFGSSDFVRTKAEQAAGKLNSAPEFKIPEFKLETQAASASQAKSLTDSPPKPEGEDLRKAFQDFVGQTLFSQMISSMRSTQEGAAYFDGGRAEKIFQGQLDQILSEKLSEASASKISDPMFKLFQLRRQ